MPSLDELKKAIMSAALRGGEAHGSQFSEAPTYGQDYVRGAVRAIPQGIADTAEGLGRGSGDVGNVVMPAVAPDIKYPEQGKEMAEYLRSTPLASSGNIADTLGEIIGAPLTQLTKIAAGIKGLGAVIGGLGMGIKSVGKEKKLVELLKDTSPRPVVGATERKLGFDPEKIAADYPENLPPVETPRTGGKEGTYPAKQLSPEGEALQREKARVNKIIATGDYPKVFDTEKRFYADPSRYEREGNTLTDAVAKKEETLDKWRAMFDTRDIHNFALKLYDKAKDNPLAHKWYAMGQLEKAYTDTHGMELGSALFRKRLAEAMAATTTGQAPDPNFLMAHYMNYLDQKKLPVPTESWQLPYPIGGDKAMTNVRNYDKMILQGGGLQASEHPKGFNFSGNLMGYPDPMTLDTRITGKLLDRFSEDPLKAPPKGSYGVAEAALGKAAAKRDPRKENFQGVVWSALGESEPMIETINKIVARNAMLMRKKPEDILIQHLLKAQGPLYGAAGGTLGAKMMADQLRGDEDGGYATQ